MIDPFENYAASLEGPAEHHFAIAPSDTTDLVRRPRAIRIGGEGIVVLRDVAGVDVAYAVAAGEILPIRCVRVLATGTTATNITGWS